MWLAGALVFATHLLAAKAINALALAELFNQPGLNWLGLITKKPVTEDYVPLVPWLGVMWWGVASGQWLLAHRPQALAGRGLPGTAALAWLGRWSLPWYMLHQPVLIGALMGVGWWLTP